MAYVIKGYDSAALRFFEEFSAIPHVSYHEREIVDYIEAFARARGLAYYRDEANNILVTKPGTTGRENEDVLMLQAHTDMVGEKTAESTHDLLREGIRLVQQGNLLRADGTTLGADDGMGVALMLAVLDECEDHPPLECLFTATEETGLEGAMRFDYSRIRARNLVNLDSAEETDIIIGCCGGHRTNIALPVTASEVEGEGIAIAISGLCGGHSGEDIHRGRANALVMMQHLLSAVSSEMPLRIASIEGGTKENVIPRAASARIFVADIDRAMLILQEACERERAACLAEEDAGLTFVLSRTPFDTLLSDADTARILRLLSIPHGVLVWRREGVFAETSRNLARVCIKEGELRVALSTRSLLTDALNESDAVLAAFAKEVGATIATSGYYGWESDENASIVQRWRDAYRSVTGKEMRVTPIHAGLECGVICNGVGNMDAIAIGCNIHNLHSPDECMELDSFLRVEATLRAFLAK